MPDNKTSETSAGQECVRLDKWLWAARFFKTRKLSTAAINGGKVSLNGSRSQPGKRVRAGDEIRLSRGHERMVVTVKAISDRRRGAPEAALLYEETAESLQQRNVLKQQRRTGPAAPPNKPDKRARQLLARIKRNPDEQ